MIETLVMYVSAQTSVKVLRIAATATTIGISTAGSVPKTNSRMTSAPRPPIIASSRTLEPPPHRLLDRRAPGCVAGGVEDDDVRWAHADAECLQRPLARLVRGLARDREALIPARGELAGGDAAEHRQHDPDADHRPAMTSGE